MACQILPREANRSPQVAWMSSALGASSGNRDDTRIMMNTLRKRAMVRPGTIPPMNSLATDSPVIAL